MNKRPTKKKKSKYDEVIKIPVSFEKAIGLLVKNKPKKKAKKRS